MKTSPQPGITNRPPDHVIVAAYTLTTTDPPTTHAAVERLREVVHRELKSDLDDTTPASPKDQPSAETGELGFTDGYDRYRLTVTVGFAKAAYDKLGVAADNQPQDLRPIPWDKLADAPTSTAENGDILLQVCSESVYVAEHVLRRVGEELGDVLTVVWAVAGHQRHTSRAGRPSRDEGRALIGFLDGTSNLNPRRVSDDAKLVFVDPDPATIAAYPPKDPVIPPGQPNPYGGAQLPTFPPELHEVPTREPEWTRNGTYMVVRAGVFDASLWDKRALGDQEHTVGRFKISGQALDKPDDAVAEIVPPDFAADAEGAITPRDAHIRKVNPRGPGDDARRIFRRGYPLISAVGASGLQRGLVFICFARTITTQFEFITRAWATNADFPAPGAGVDRLRAIETVLCGGYFFVPPVAKANTPWSFVVPEA
jgi:deferrochelatase/peroxidase EfeB